MILAIIQRLAFIAAAGVAVTAHEVAPHLGSDHLPELVGLCTLADGP